MSKKTKVGIFLEKLKNHPIFAPIIIIGILISIILGFWSKIVEVLPENKDKEIICNEIETSHLYILEEIDKIEKKDMTFAVVFQIRKLLRSFISLQDKNREFQCQIITLDLKKQVIKDKIMSMTFVQIEHWKTLENLNLNTENVKEIVKSLCEILLEFMQETQQNNEEELIIINNTIKSCLQ